MQIIFSEKELEDFLCEDGNLKKHLDLEFIARQVKIPPAGIIDILAYSRSSERFVIIELKRDLLDLQALSQGLSYLNYYQQVRGFNYIHRRRKRKFSLLFVGQNLSSDLEKIVTHCEYDNFLVDGEIYYKLFNLNLNTGISFNFFDRSQNDYASLINEEIDKLEIESSNRIEAKNQF